MQLFLQKNSTLFILLYINFILYYIYQFCIYWFLQTLRQCIKVGIQTKTLLSHDN